MTSRDGKQDAIIAFTAGALIGAGIALFLTPKTGKQMRGDVRRLGKKALNKTQALRSELHRSINTLANEVWEKLQEDIDHGREWTEETLSEVLRALDAGKDFIRGEIEKVGRG
jgi:gas vesicle protein